MSLHPRTVGSIRWTIGEKLAGQGIQFLISVVLARLLSPVEFGQVGMILVFSGFTQIFAEAGFGVALVQREVIEERHKSSVFFVNVALGIAMMTAFFLAAPAVARFYEAPAVEPMAKVMSVSFFIVGFTVVQQALYMREMRFDLLAKVKIFSAVGAGAAAIAMAASGFGAWSLIARLLLVSGLTSVAFWLFSSWRPRLILQWRAIADLLNVSGNYLGFRVVNYWVRNLDNLLIGRFVGSHGLGVYTRAYVTMLQPVNQVVGSVAQVMFSALSRVQADHDKVRGTWLRANRIIAFITFPMYAGLFLVAEEFVWLVLGPKWHEVTPVLRVLCLAGLPQPVASTAGWITTALGRTDVQFRWNLLYGVLLFIAFAIGVRWGIMGVAAAYAIRNAVIFPSAVGVPAALIDIRLRTYLRQLVEPALLAAWMAVVVFVSGFLTAPLPMLGRFVIEVAVGVVVYTATAHFTKATAYLEARKAARELLGR